MRLPISTSTLRLGGIAALSSLAMQGHAQAQSALRVDFTLQQASGPALSPTLANTGYMLLTFDDSTPLLTDGVTTTFAPTYTAELHLDGAHAPDTPPTQIGSLYQLGQTYGLSLELNQNWSEAGVSRTDGYLFSFDATTGALPLLDSPSAFALFAAQQAATSQSGHLYLSADTSSELGTTHQDYDFAATISNVSVVPEPASVSLWSLGGMAMASLMAARRRRHSHVSDHA